MLSLKKLTLFEIGLQLTFFDNWLGVLFVLNSIRFHILITVETREDHTPWVIKCDIQTTPSEFLRTTSLHQFVYRSQRQTDQFSSEVYQSRKLNASQIGHGNHDKTTSQCNNTWLQDRLFSYNINEAYSLKGVDQRLILDLEDCREWDALNNSMQSDFLCVKICTIKFERFCWVWRVRFLLDILWLITKCRVNMELCTCQTIANHPGLLITQSQRSWRGTNWWDFFSILITWVISLVTLSDIHGSQLLSLFFGVWWSS